MKANSATRNAAGRDLRDRFLTGLRKRVRVCCPCQRRSIEHSLAAREVPLLPTRAWICGFDPVPLQAVIADKEARADLLAFMQKQYCAENVMFLCRCAELDPCVHRLASGTSLSQRQKRFVADSARTLLDFYITGNSQWEVNITAGAKSRLMQACQSLTKETPSDGDYAGFLREMQAARKEIERLVPAQPAYKQFVEMSSYRRLSLVKRSSTSAEGDSVSYPLTPESKQDAPEAAVRLLQPEDPFTEVKFHMP